MDLEIKSKFMKRLTMHKVQAFLCFAGVCLTQVHFTHILQGYFTGTGAIIRLPQWQWSNPEGYGQMYHMNLQELKINHNICNNT